MSISLKFATPPQEKHGRSHLKWPFPNNLKKMAADVQYIHIVNTPEPTKVHKFMNFLYSGQLFLESIDKSLKAFKTYKTYQTFNSWLLGGGEHIHMTI